MDASPRLRRVVCQQSITTLEYMACEYVKREPARRRLLST